MQYDVRKDSMSIRSRLDQRISRMVCHPGRYNLDATDWTLLQTSAGWDANHAETVLWEPKQAQMQSMTLRGCGLAFLVSGQTIHGTGTNADIDPDFNHPNVGKYGSFMCRVWELLQISVNRAREREREIIYI